MTAVERFNPRSSLPDSRCPAWLRKLGQDLVARRKTRSQYWWACAEDRYHTTGFADLDFQYHEGQPHESQDVNPGAWLKYRNAVARNADCLLMLHRYRVALEEHDPRGDVMVQCQASLRTYDRWEAPEWMTWWNEDLARVMRGER